MLLSEVTMDLFVDPLVKLMQCSWLADITFGSIIVRIVLAIICGGVIGVERATKKQAAGFRTYILVCMGACIAMFTNQFIFQTIGSGDVARLGAGVVTGIGFLGAGTIMITSINQIRGLTTAAGLWACGCVGLSFGIGFYTLGITATIAILIVLMFLPRLESYFIEHSKFFEIHIELSSRPDLKCFISYCRDHDLVVRSVEHNDAYSNTGLSVYTINLEDVNYKNEKKKKHTDIVKQFSELQYVNYVELIY